MRRTKATGSRFTFQRVVLSAHMKLFRGSIKKGKLARRASFHFPSITPSQGSIYFYVQVIPGPFCCDPRKSRRPLLSYLLLFFFFFNVTGFRVTSSSSQFSSRDSAQFSDSGSADEVDEFEIQGMN